MAFINNKKQLKRDIAGYLFTLPVILGVIIFTYIPAVQSLVYSFYETDGFLQMDFVRFKNFIRIFSTDIETAKVFINTAVYTVITVPLGLVLGYLLAMLVNSKMKGITAYRILFYLPVIIPGVAGGLLWRDLFDPTYGIMSQFFGAMGMQPTFFSEANTSMATLIWTTTWGIGGGMVIWLAAFKNIPESLYESASLDGANSIVKFFKITIPMTTPMIFYNLVTSLIGTLQISSTLIIAGGTSGKGIDGSLYFIAVKIYNEAFTRGAMGYACSLGWLLFLVIGILTFVMFKANKWVQYAEDN